MPLLEPWERALALLDAGARGERDAFYTRFVLDPVSELTERGAGRVIQVRHAQEGAGWGDEAEPMDSPELVGDTAAEPGSWRWIRMGQSEAPKDGVIIVDLTGIAYPRGTQIQWLLVAYVPPLPPLSGRIQQFRAEVNKIFEDRPHGGPEFLRRLKGAYAEAFGEKKIDFNPTSLCLYSGPGIGNGGAFLRRSFGSPGFWPSWQSWHWPWPVFGAQEVGWLGTGDSCLDSDASIDAFHRHYASSLGRVGTLALPHHGADKNFAPKLLSPFPRPLLCAANARTKDPYHPGGVTLAGVFADPERALVQVSEEPGSRLDEFGKT